VGRVAADGGLLDCPGRLPSETEQGLPCRGTFAPGREVLPADKVLATKKGGFVLWLSVHGSYEQVRSSDGVHLLPAGYDLLAKALVQPMQRAWHVNLHV